MSKDEWLTRTTGNLVSGPYTRQQVIEKVQSGELHLQDEVCQANEYWFYLHEAEEVVKFLGIEVPHPKPVDAERTNTETQTDGGRELERTDPDFPRHQLNPEPEPPRTDSKPQAQTKEAPVPAAGGSKDSSRDKADLNHDRDMMSSAKLSVSLAQRIERPAIWQTVVWLLVIAIVGVVAAVLRLLKP